MTVASRLSELGVTLPEPIAPAFHYAAVVESGGHAYVSGQLPKTGADHGMLHVGRVPEEVSTDEARDCARLCVINAFSVLESELGFGTLDRIERVVQVTGFVAAPPDFGAHPKVIDAASTFLTDVFGEAGRHARAAVGVASLPRRSPVEIAFVFRLRPGAGAPS
ncbi:MAG: RidA family protein [Trueperaceae bacterium]|nr:RidA family protein [Trueperaceae bacterium]